MASQSGEGRKEETMATSPDRLKTRHGFNDYMYWTLFFAIHFITALVAISKHSTAWLICYVIVGISILILILKFYCSHCPHYVCKGKTVKCMFFWGVPKLFEPKPGPLGPSEKAVTLVLSVLWILFPVYWLILEPGLLVIYWLSLLVFVLTVKKNECARCVYFHCPVNAVPEDVRSRFESN